MSRGGISCAFCGKRLGLSVGNRHWGVVFSIDSVMLEVLDLPIVSSRDLSIGASQIERVVRIGSSVPAILHRVGLASFVVVMRDGRFGIDEYFRSFDDGSREARHDVELDVAMEQPNAYTLSAISCKRWKRVTYLDCRL